MVRVPSLQGRLSINLYFSHVRSMRTQVILPWTRHPSCLPLSEPSSRYARSGVFTHKVWEKTPINNLHTGISCQIYHPSPKFELISGQGVSGWSFTGCSGCKHQESYPIALPGSHVSRIQYIVSFGSVSQVDGRIFTRVGIFIMLLIVQMGEDGNPKLNSAGFLWTLAYSFPPWYALY